MSAKSPKPTGWTCVSSKLSIGLASVFVVVAAAVSLVVDRPAAGPNPLGSGWTLRGAFAPIEPPVRNQPVHAKTQKVPRWT